MSMHWAALLTDVRTDSSSACDTAGIALWALQFTPRVTCSGQAVMLETAQSLRLFGGQAQLHAQVESGAREMGVLFTAWAPTRLAALAFAEAGIADGFAKPLAQMLDLLPFDCLSAVRVHAATLARLGCRTLADVRRLPRGGISRRFDKQLLLALDQAYGLRPEVCPWITLPLNFAARLELPGRVDTACGLLFGARRLLLQMSGWLAARHAGATAFTLRWRHDDMRARTAGEGGDITIRTAEPTQNVDHLCRLLTEHLAQVVLLAPVSDIEILATEVSPMAEKNHSLLQDMLKQSEVLGQVLERIEARLGKKRVLLPRLLPDHRLECMQCWQALDAPSPTAAIKLTQVPQPAWMLRTPLKLAMLENQPIYQGPLLLLLGPDRVEGSWWLQANSSEGKSQSRTVQRDYWVALSVHAGALWIFQQRLDADDAAWYLHGHFA